MKGSSLLALFIAWAVAVPFLGVQFGHQVRRMGSVGRLVVATAILYSFADVAVTLRGAEVNTYDVLGNPVSLSPEWASQVRSLSLLLLTSIAVLMLLFDRGVDWSRLRLAGTAAVMVVLTSAVAAGLNHHKPLTYRQFALIAVLLVSATARDKEGAGRGAVVVGLLLAGFSPLAYLVRPSAVIAACPPDKCSPAGALFGGVLGDGNALGLALCVSFAALLAIVPIRVAAAVTPLFALEIIFTGSRTAISASLAVIVGRVLLRWGRRWGRGICVAGILAIIGYGLSLPFGTNSGNAYALRGSLWLLGREQFSAHPLFGSGWNALSSFFSSSGGFAGTSSYSLHNQWIDALYSAGLIGALGVGVLVYSLLRASFNGGDGLMLMLLAVTVCGCLERAWSFGAIDWMSWSLVAAVGLAGSTTAEEAARVSASPNTGDRWSVSWTRA